VYAVVGLAAAGNISAEDLRDVLAHPSVYEGRHIELEGIARVPSFHLFLDTSAAEKRDYSKALLVRQKVPGTPNYTDLDRQWVKIVGTMHSSAASAENTWIDLDRAQILQGRPAPHIKDATVFGVFQNATKREVRIDLSNASAWIPPGESSELVIHEGPVLVFADQNSSPEGDLQRTVARGKISFSGLASGYEYSPPRSTRRTLYYRITDSNIESVTSLQAKAWKVKR
jgi:hypothetical protein